MERKAEHNRQFLKTGEVAEILGVTQATVRAAVRRGDLAGVKLGTHFLVARSGIEQLTERVTQKPPEAA